MTQPGYLKVAIATNSLTDADANFAAARQLVIYDVTTDDAVFVDALQFAPKPAGDDVSDPKAEGSGKGRNGGACKMDNIADEGVVLDIVSRKVEALKECGVLFTLGLSDPQAVKVHEADCFPVKMEKSRPIDEVLERLQTMMRGNPPLWLCRALRYRAA